MSTKDLPVGKQMKVYLAGKHDLHVGCIAVFEALTSIVLDKGWQITDYDNADIVIVNGEGSMHHFKEKFEDTAKYHKIELLEKAKRDGKQAYLVNTVWEDNKSERVANLIRSLNYVCVRELMSWREMRKIIPHVDIGIDLAYFTPVSDKPTNAYKDQIIVGDFHNKKVLKDKRLKFLKELPKINIRGYASWENYVNDLKNAKLIITGRQHEVFAACSARLPFATFAGNTHKVEGVMRMAEVRIPVAENANGLLEAIEFAQDKNNQIEFDKLFHYLEKQERWKL